MSNGNGISFVHDLVAMATAADKVPQLEEQISELRKALDAQTASNWELEAKIIDHTNAHSETKARLHNAEVARDDAERLFLEADDAKLAAVRAMRVVIGEAEAFIKAVTPEVVKPSYEGKWLMDVQGWSSISLTQWLENGGSNSRFVIVKPPESTSPNAPSESTWSMEDKPSFQMAAEQETASRLQSAAYSIGATQVEVYPSKGEGETTNPNPTVSDLAHTQAGLVVESEVGPTANTLGIEHGGSQTVQYDHAADKESASTTMVEGQSEANPTAASHSGSASQTADTGGAGTQESASEKLIDDDLWAIPSRASHYS